MLYGYFIQNPHTNHAKITFLNIKYKIKYKQTHEQDQCTNHINMIIQNTHSSHFTNLHALVGYKAEQAKGLTTNYSTHSKNLNLKNIK